MAKHNLFIQALCEYATNAKGEEGLGSMMYEIFAYMGGVTPEMIDLREPKQEVGTDERCIGVASVDVRKLFCTRMYYAEKTNNLLKELTRKTLEEGPIEIKMAFIRNLIVTHRKMEIAGYLLWMAIDQEFRELYEKTHRGIRKGWEIVCTDDEMEECKSVAAYFLGLALQANPDKHTLH